MFRHRAQRQYRQEGETPISSTVTISRVMKSGPLTGSPLASLLARGTGQLAGDGQHRNDVAEAVSSMASPMAMHCQLSAAAKPAKAEPLLPAAEA